MVVKGVLDSVLGIAVVFIISVKVILLKDDVV